MNNKSYKVALGGVISALCLLTMFLTGITPILSIVLPMIAGILMLIIVNEISISWAFLTYIAVSLLSMMVTFDKEAVILFITFFGHYPIIRVLIEKLNSKIIKIILKILVFNICILSFFGITTYILKLTAFLEEILEFGKYGGIIMIGIGNLIFFMYEYNLKTLSELYILRLKPLLNKKK